VREGTREGGRERGKEGGREGRREGGSLFKAVHLSYAIIERSGS